MVSISSEQSVLHVKSAIGHPAGHPGPWVGGVNDALFHGMPGRLKVLYIATLSRTGAWLAEPLPPIARPKSSWKRPPGRQPAWNGFATRSLTPFS